MTVQELQAKLDQFSLMTDQFSVENSTTREIKLLQREINEHFKYINISDPEEKAQLKHGFEKKIAFFKEKQVHVNEANEVFTAETEEQIGKLKEKLGEPGSDKVITKEDFIDIKKAINETMARFRQNRFPSKEKKEEAWAIFSVIREQLKKQEDNFYDKQRESKEKQNEASAALAEKIIPAIETCHPEVNDQNMADRIATFLGFATEANYKAPGFEFLSAKSNEEEKKHKSPLLSKSESLRAFRKFLNENREIISREDRSKIQFVVEEVQTDLDKAWTLHKEELQKKREEWEVKRKENDEKRVEWEKKQKEFFEKLEARHANQAQFKTKLEAIYHKQIGFQEKLEKRLIDQLAFIGKLNVQLEGLDEKYESARTDQFAETVAEWINEKKAKIADVEDDVADLEDKLKDVKTRTEELSDKIRDIEVSKKEISNKIDEVKKKLGRVKPADKTTPQVSHTK